MSRATALAVLLLALGARAGTYTWSGGLGGGAARSDSWSSGGPRSSQPSWDWDLDGSFGGIPFRPGLLTFLANGQYRSSWAGYQDGSSTAQGLAYGLQLSLLSDSSLPISFSASRSLGTFETDAAVQRTGRIVTNTESGTIVLRSEGYPTLRAQLLRTDLDNESFGAPQTSTGSTVLSLGASQATARQEYSLAYDTGWNEGTDAETNYRSHAIQAQASTAVSDSVRLRISERYFLRLPTVDASGNPRYDDNNLSAGLQWRPGERLTSSLDYSFRHMLVTAPATPDREQLGHSIRESTSWNWTDELVVNGTAGLLATSERLDGKSINGDAGTVGAGLSWRRRVSPAIELMLGGGGSLGVARPPDTEAQLAYGGTATAGVNAAGESTRGTATYSGSYQRNTSGLTGSTLTQQLNLTGDAVLRSTLLRATVLLSGARRDDPLLGTFFSRSASASLGLTWSRHGVQLSAGESEGVSEALAVPGVSDGLFLPANYNTRTRYATLSSGFSVPGTRLVVSALARTLSIESPDRPIRHEHGASLTASYMIGLTSLSFEERFSRGGSGDMWQTGNLVLVRVMRTFGGRL